MRKQIGRTLLETQTSLWAMHSYNQTNREATNLLISFHKTHKKRIEPRTKINFLSSLSMGHTRKILIFYVQWPNQQDTTNISKCFCTSDREIMAPRETSNQHGPWLLDVKAVCTGLVAHLLSTLLHLTALPLDTTTFPDLLPLNRHPYLSLSTNELGKAAFAPSPHPRQYLDLIILG
jgi:hypothetical protein